MTYKLKRLLPAILSLPIIPLAVRGVVLANNPYTVGRELAGPLSLALPLVLAGVFLYNRQRAAAVVNFTAFLLALFLQQSLPLARINYEGSTKGNLGAIRSALSIYYGDLEGHYPEGLDALTVNGKYIQSIPASDTRGRHPKSSQVTFYSEYPPKTPLKDTGGWGYVNNPRSKEVGVLFVDCTHTDSKGLVWASF